MISAFIGIGAGIGTRPSELERGEIRRAMFTFWLCELLYVLTTLFVRLSIAVFLLSICFYRYQRWILHGAMVILALYATIFFFVLFFQCSPVRHFWHRYDTIRGRCISDNIVPDMTVVHSAMAISVDLILGGLPIIMISHTRMAVRKKLSVTAILATTAL